MYKNCLVELAVGEIYREYRFNLHRQEYRFNLHNIIIHGV